MADSVLGEIEEGLRSCAQARHDAEIARAEATAGLVEWLIIGREHGAPISRMADWAGVTRQTVYDLLTSDTP